jgi:hypothetical protein
VEPLTADGDNESCIVQDIKGNELSLHKVSTA